MQSLTAFHLQQWIDEHRDALRPPRVPQRLAGPGNSACGTCGIVVPGRIEV